MKQPKSPVIFDSNIMSLKNLPSFLPPSTATPRLQLQREESPEEDEQEEEYLEEEEHGRGKRRRISTLSHREAR